MRSSIIEVCLVLGTQPRQRAASLRFGDIFLAGNLIRHRLIPTYRGIPDRLGSRQRLTEIPVVQHGLMLAFRFLLCIDLPSLLVGSFVASSSFVSGLLSRGQFRLKFGA